MQSKIKLTRIQYNHSGMVPSIFSFFERKWALLYNINHRVLCFCFYLCCSSLTSVGQTRKLSIWNEKREISINFSYRSKRLSRRCFFSMLVIGTNYIFTLSHALNVHQFVCHTLFAVNARQFGAKPRRRRCCFLFLLSFYY